jgi:C1A family cysteine protease
MPKHPFNVKIDRIHHTELQFMELPKLTQLPQMVDLRPRMPPIYDQGQLGSCTANALCGVMQYADQIPGSRLFLYYNERKLENDIPDDAGANLSDGIKCLQKYGICPDTEWPYEIYKFTKSPPKQCYDDASKHKAITVQNIQQDITLMKTSLARGNPFVVGINVYESFESNEVSKSGIVPIPQHNEHCLGGHAVVCVGYDDHKQCWIMRNSWGNTWGMSGYFTLPYLYLLDSSLSSDLWNISKAS